MLDFSSGWRSFSRMVFSELMIRRVAMASVLMVELDGFTQRFRKRPLKGARSQD